MVKRIVADLISLHPQWRDLVAQYELVAAQARPEWGESTEQLALRGRIDEHWHELETGYAGRQPIPEVVPST